MTKTDNKNTTRKSKSCVASNKVADNLTKETKQSNSKPKRERQVATCNETQENKILTWQEAASNDRLIVFKPSGELDNQTTLAMSGITVCIGSDCVNLIKWIQKTINTDQTGIFGISMFNNIRKIQEEHGINPSGIVDKKTWIALLK